MKSGDKVICKKVVNNYIVGKEYNVIIATDNNYAIENGGDIGFSFLLFTEKEFNKNFLSVKELRKKKLDRISKL